MLVTLRLSGSSLTMILFIQKKRDIGVLRARYQVAEDVPYLVWAKPGLRCSVRTTKSV